jgi:hypothetical protein
MGRWVGGSHRLRHILIADWDASMLRWRVPGRPPSDYERRLKAGEAVGLSSATLLCALMRAGLPYRDCAFGGRYCGQAFVLNERDELHGA